MRPPSYIAAAKKLREYADKIEGRANASTPRERAALTSAIHGVSWYAQTLSKRHRKAKTEKMR